MYTQVHPPLKTDGLGLAWLGCLVLYLNIVARHIKRFKTAVAMEFARRDCDWFKGEKQDSELGPE